MPSRRAIVTGSVFLLAAGSGSAVMGNSFAAADSVTGEVSVACRFIRSSQVYDLAVARSGVAPSSFYVSCDLSSNVADSHGVSGTIARLYRPPAGLGDSCGAGQGRIEEYSEVSVSSAAAIPMTLYENSLPRDLPDCNDNLARISVKFEILA